MRNAKMLMAMQGRACRHRVRPLGLWYLIHLVHVCIHPPSIKNLYAANVYLLKYLSMYRCKLNEDEWRILPSRRAELSLGLSGTRQDANPRLNTEDKRKKGKKRITRNQTPEKKGGEWDKRSISWWAGCAAFVLFHPVEIFFFPFSFYATLLFFFIHSAGRRRISIFHKTIFGVCLQSTKNLDKMTGQVKPGQARPGQAYSTNQKIPFVLI